MTSVINDYKSNYGRIKVSSIGWFLLSVQLILSNVAKHSIFYQISALLFIIFILTMVVRYQFFTINKYYLISIIFLFYNIIFLFFGTNIYSVQHSSSMLNTVMLNLILYIVIYNFLIYTNNINKMLKLYIFSSFMSNIIILIIHRDSLLQGRLSFAWGESISKLTFLGVEINTIGSNGIAFYSAISILFSIYLINQKTKVYLYVPTIFFFLFVILITGSRKGLFLSLFGMVFLIFLISKNIKKFIYLFLSSVFIIVMYVLINTIDSLYKIIGVRVEELIVFLLEGETMDSSVNTRIRLLEMAWEFIIESPIYGYGLDAFRLMGPWGIIVDNNYLEILVSGGLIGFVIYYSIYLLVFVEFVRLKNKNNLIKLFFVIFILTIILEIGSVTYFERMFGFVNVILYVVLRFEREKGKENIEKKIKRNDFKSMENENSPMVSS